MESKRTWSILRLFLVCAAMAGILLCCWEFFSYKKQPKISLEEKLRIVAIIPDSSGVNVEAIRREAEKAAEKRGAFVDFYLTATKEEQLQVLQIAVDSNVDGVMLYPFEPVGYSASLIKCKHKGIPVTVISQNLEHSLYDSFIGTTSNSERMAALSCVSATEGKGKLLFIDRQVVDGRLYFEAVVLEPLDGTEGLHKNLKTKVSNIVNSPFEGYLVKDISVLDEQEASSSKLYTAVQNLLDTHQPDAVFSYSEEVMAVVANFAANSNSLAETYIVGYGNPEEYVSQLRDGTIDGVVAQNASYATELGIRFLIQLCSGSQMPASADAGINIISIDNLDRFLDGN